MQMNIAWLQVFLTFKHQNGGLWNDEEFLPLILESGHSRFPVIGEDRDEVEGILLAKDLLRHYAEDSGAFDLKDLLREAVVIPESKRLNMLLKEAVRKNKTIC